MKLSEEAERWYNETIEAYSITDEAGKLLTLTAAECLTRMREAQELINKEGLTFKDRFNQLKAHPATSIERDNRAQMIMCLKALNLDFDA